MGIAERIDRAMIRAISRAQGGGAPARVFRSFMQSALQVDGARGPRLPRDFNPNRLPPPERQSPVPTELDDALENFARELVDFLENL